MARPQSRYVCQTCGEAFLRWEGQCRACGAWNSLVETIVRDAPRERRSAPRQEPFRRGPDAALGARRARIFRGCRSASPSSTGSSAAASFPDRSCSSAASPASGSRRSCSRSRRGSRPAGGRVLYATGEESGGPGAPPGGAPRPARRAASVDGVRVLAENDVARIVDAARARRPGLVVVDSIQTATLEELDGPAGSVGQVRESALRFMELAKGDGIAVVLVGHVTKDGSLAGPKTLEHLVDAVLSLEGERGGTLRLLRAVEEPLRIDRRGRRPRDGRGRPSRGRRSRRAPSSSSTRCRRPAASSRPTLEGSRPLLVEVQALVAPTGYGTPRRTAIGLDPNRLALLVAVLGRRAGVGLGSHDVYANLAGGIAVDDPALDLPARASPSPRRSATGRCARAPSPSARSASSASSGRSAGPSDASARRHASASPGPSCRGRGRRPRRSGPGGRGVGDGPRRARSRGARRHRTGVTSGVPAGRSRRRLTTRRGRC